MSRRAPLYLTQNQVDRLASILFRHQHVIDVLSPAPHTGLEAGCFLSLLREQCCKRSGLDDPFSDMDLWPAFDEAGDVPQENCV